MKFETVMSASRKFLVTRETMSVFPSLPAFARLLEATIDLHHAMVQEGKETVSAVIAFRLWRLALTIVGDVTLFWKRWR